MDVHVSSVITRALRRVGVSVVTAEEDGARRLRDPELLDRALELGAVLFTQDQDFLREGASRQRLGEPFAGVIHAHQVNVTDGDCIRDLGLIGLAGEPSDFTNTVWHLPLAAAKRFL